jgi:acyl-coenzyme A thioesterase 9
MHGRIFGGFLMRRAFELAFATTYMFAGSRPSFVRVDEVTFRSVLFVVDDCTTSYVA